jgi:hypothetical protein
MLRLPNGPAIFEKLRKRTSKLELALVFRDELDHKERWDNSQIEFRDLSSREKRRGEGSVEVRHMRYVVRYFRQHSRLAENIDFRYVVLRE